MVAGPSGRSVSVSSKDLMPAGKDLDVDEWRIGAEMHGGSWETEVMPPDIPDVPPHVRRPRQIMYGVNPDCEACAEHATVCSQACIEWFTKIRRGERAAARPPTTDAPTEPMVDDAAKPPTEGGGDGLALASDGPRPKLIRHGYCRSRGHAP